MCHICDNIRVTDSTSATASGTVTVSVVDVNDETPVIAGGSSFSVTVNEGQNSGTTITIPSFSASDADSGDTISYAISGQFSVSFWI